MQKVLVAEDDATVLALIRRILEDEGFLVAEADDLDGAWSQLMAEDPDAAIVDLRLAWSQSGWDLIERIRANEHFHDLPIVVVTGMTGSEIVERVTAAGCAYVSKPFSPPALVERLRQTLRQAGRLPQLRVWPVMVLLPGYRVAGNLHASAELERLSDAWEAVVRDPRAYVPVSDATIHGDDGIVQASSRPVVELRKDQILAVFAAD